LRGVPRGLSQDLSGVRISKERWALGREIAALRSFDIGIMPLDDTLWARGKCGYKILQYMGVGVPAVASPVGINSEFIRHGETGFLASSPEAWHKALKVLVAERQTRQAFGLKGRGLVEEYYSQEHFSAQYLKVFREVAKLG